MRVGPRPSSSLTRALDVRYRSRILPGGRKRIYCFQKRRRLIAQKWTYARKGPGRPNIAQEITDLVLRMARENATWGYDRIQGSLANIGHTVAPNTVKNILKRHGIEPAPVREKCTSWKTFLKAHWEVMAATDFFTVEVWTSRGLVTY